MAFANLLKPEEDLLSWAFSWLRDRIPSTWTLETPLGPTGDPENVLRLTGNNSFASILVEEKGSLTPRQAEGLVSGFAPGLRSMNPGTALLVLAPWLSERTREILTGMSINYMDQTGNVRLRLDNPALYIQTTGANRNPEPKERGKAQVRGAKAARLIRLLIDVCPPFSPGKLAEAAGLAPGYVSRLLETLYDEALIERVPRGPIEHVDTQGLIRRWARSYDVLKTNRIATFVAPAGIDHALKSVGAQSPSLAITGSRAAVRLAPVTAPAMLLAYCERPEVLARELGLLPTSEGADVILLEPFDPIVWWSTEVESDLRFVSPSQVAIDCLTGNGRMPAEGEAVLAWMEQNEATWQKSSLPRPGEISIRS